MTKYNIEKLRKLENKLALLVRKHFVDFFRAHNYVSDTADVVSFKIKSWNDVERVCYGTGFYLILTDYPAGENGCSFVVDGLKAIYRGHCYTVKSRLISHLFNTQYRLWRHKVKNKSVTYNVCMKLDDKNGINILEAPYNKYQWRVIVYKMKGSSRMIREQAELAFDKVYSRPIGSKERMVDYT